MGGSNRTVRRVIATGAGLALAAGLVACSDLSADATRSGGEPPPVVLTIGSDDPAGRPATNQMEEFAGQVASLSDGALRIETRPRAAGLGNDDWDQAVARLVVAGDLDLGMIPARAWDTEGVTTLRALTTPLLVTTDDHMDAVALDDELSQDLMSGLDQTGVTGLALVPEGIRYLLVPAGGRATVEQLAAGGTVRSPWSETTWAFFRALGARPSDAELTAGERVPTESEVALAGTVGAADNPVGNLPLFPKLNSLVVNTGTFDELTEEQRGWLREAAYATRDWAVDTRQSDHELATTLCDGGGTVVHDPHADSADVADAAAAVTEDLRDDAVTAELIDRIAALGSSAPEPLARCSPATAAVTPETLVPDPGRIPDGVYRVEFSDDYLRQQGLTREMAGINHGVWTITLRDGQWQVEQVASDITDTFQGSYEVRGDDLYWLFDEEQVVFRVPWSLGEDGSLRFGQVDGPPDGHHHWGLPWERVGDTREGETSGDREVTAGTIVAEGGNLPDGTYRARFTDAYLAAHGLPPDDVLGNHGVWTTVLDDGHWTVDQVAPDITDHFEGIYQVSGHDLWWRVHDEPLLFHLRWSVTGDGDLVFEEVPEPEVPDFQFDLLWHRVD